MPGTPEQLALLNIHHYKFSSKTEGRDSTFYFSDGVGTLGRIKRSASSGGESGLFTKKGTWLFISPQEREQLENVFDEAEDMVEFLIKTAKKLNKGESEEGYSLTKQTGWTVFEIFGDGTVHPSQGVIMGIDPDATEENIKKIMSSI